MANELCMRCFSVKGKYSVCPFCGYEDGTPPDKSFYLMPGTILAGHFIVGISIGSSEYGITYKCYDMTLGIIAIVKEFYSENLVKRAEGHTNIELVASNNEKEYNRKKRRFIMEAQSIARFSKTKDIVNVYDSFEENNTAYVVMEYVDDDLLQERLKEGKMPPDKAFLIMEKIIEAVKKIHAQGIVHRDIHPGNIFISLDDKIKIFDFGAAYLNDTSEGVPDSIVIKPGYSAPEQYHDNARQGYFTDIYPLGAIYYQMLTGEKPPDASKREVKDALKSPMELGVDIEINTDRAVMEALAIQPGLRFQGIQQFDDAVHGKRIAEYPKDKIKRSRMKRNWVLVCTGLILTAAVVGLALLNKFSQKENIMFDTRVTKDTVSIWVDSEDSKEALDSIKSGLSEINAEDSEAIVQIKNENKDITFEIRDITVKDNVYKNKYENMDSALQAALDGKEEFPDIFISDNVSGIEQYDLVSYEDNVYQNINIDDYLYFSAYNQYFPDMKEMPVSFDVLLFYAIDTDNSSVTDLMKKQFKSRKIQASTLTGRARENGTIELKEIFEANSSGAEHTYFDEHTAAMISIFYNKESFDNYNGVLDFDTQFPDTYSDCIKIRGQTLEQAKWKTSSAKDAVLMYGNSVLAGSGYRSQWFEAKLGNNPIPYKVFVPVADGKMLVQYKMKLAVSAKSSKNKQIAAMRFVYFALGQQQCAVDRNTAYPVSDAMLQNSEGELSTFDEFFTINSAQSVVQSLVKDEHFPCMLLAKGSGDIAEFVNGIKKEKVTDKVRIEEYCKEFMDKRKVDSK